jgi:dihydrofolate synthase/folylpolyglutamate synthase
MPSSRKGYGRNFSLERMQPLMEALGNPQDSLRIIHIAGTSGKTSTAHYVADMISKTGKKAGLTISPHVDSVTERFQVNMRPISEKAFCRSLEQLLAKIESVTPRPTYLDILTAFAFWYFAKQKVDYAVVETGVGGLHDATNIAKPPNKVCVITDIGIDHTAILGHTVDRIAAQKAGIIRPHNVVFMYEQDEQIMRVIREVSDQQQAELHEIWPVKAGTLPTNLPLFQRRNWYLAWSVFSWTEEKDGLPELSESQLSASTETYIPARMEVIEHEGKTVVLDGSHNAQKLHALVASLKNRFPKQRMALLLGFMQTKQASLKKNIKELLPVANRIVATSFGTGIMPVDSAAPLRIAEHCEALGFEDWEIAKDPEAAFRELLNGNEKIILVTGSFYLLNHIRPLIMEKHDQGHRRNR